MADSELQDLTADTAPSGDDLVYTVNDPAGTPASRKITIANLLQTASDGWMAAGETWTYASATTFTVPTNLTAKYQKGTKLKLTQTSAKYFYVVSSSYGAPNTTVTVTGGSDYTVANAAITLPFYSYASNPQGFPGWFNYAPSFTGYSANPSGGIYRFFIDGGKCYVAIREPTPGTSNATGLTISLPVTAATITNMFWYGHVQTYLDNGAQGWNGGLYLASAATTMTLSPLNYANWTASGNKQIYGAFVTYEF